MAEKLRLGISACLLGERVRYDGQHKLDPFLKDTLGRYVEYVPVCPEVECGLPVPREAMRLVGDPAAPRLVTVLSKTDHTGRMLAWIRRRLGELERENLCGYIFKAKSPSSGMERVRIYNEVGSVVALGGGLFAREFMRRFPLLPAEDEGRLHDPELRENFIERVFALQRYRAVVRDGRSVEKLMRFHACHKLLLMAHSEKHMRAMGRLLAEARSADAAAAGRYEALLLEALRLRATVRKHVNVLQHMMGYLKSVLSADEKQELLEILGEYSRERVPLVAPLTLLRHYIRKHGIAYLRDQVYLHPHPVETQLRSHA